MLCLYIIILLLSQAFSQISIEVIDSLVHEWNSPNYPNAYTTGDSIKIKCDTGYKFSVNVTDLDIDGESGDFLLIKSDTEDEGKIFTYKLKNQRNYIINSNIGAFDFIVIGNNSIQHKGFKIKYKRIGQPSLTTTPSPDTTIAYPTPGPSINAYIIVYVGKIFYQEFTMEATRTKFRTAVAKMAQDYCKVQNIPLAEDVTVDNVKVNYVKQCPLSWPNRDYCVEIKFAVPVFLTTPDVYQLNSYHLNIMWDRLSNDYLAPDMEMYNVPNTGKASTLWIIISCIILVLFMGLILFLKRFIFQKYQTIKTDRSNEVNVKAAERNSELSLGPDPLQNTPSIFDNQYQIFEPGSSHPYSDFSNPDELGMIDMNNFKHPGNNVTFMFDIDEFET